MGYIYILTSPNGKSYIGQTIRTIEKRFEEHQQSNNCRLIYRAIKKYGWDNFEKDWYECPEEDLNFDEDLLVSEMGTLVPGGYNLRDGGGSNGKHSEETKQKMREAQKGEKNHMYGKTDEKCYWYGKTHTEETKQKMRETHIGKTPSDETRQKLSEATRGENNPMYGKTGEKNPRSKKVYQYDLDGNLINSFVSVEEASLQLGKRGSKISMCACGDRKTAYGFKWSYTHLV